MENKKLTTNAGAPVADNQHTLFAAFGAAGSLILVLVWAFYCAQLLYFGAEFTRVHAQARGLVSAGARPGA